MGSEEGELMEPTSVDIGPKWTILVADPTQGRICVFKSDGSLVMEIGHCGQLDNGEQFEPRHVATNRDNGDVVVVDGLNKRIIVFQI
jgi:DNA-binding beta-propeller fold protein YncE